MMLSPDHYDYVPMPDRSPLRWPGGHRIAVIFTINCEFWPMTWDKPEPLYPGGPASIPHVLPGDVPDYANWTWREYGHRVGVWRLFDEFDRAGVPTTCTINALTALERTPIVEAANERGWEILAHNWSQTDIMSSYAGKPDEERDVIQRIIDAYEGVLGRRPRGWLSSSLRSTHETPHLLKELGFDFMACYLNDDQPYMMGTRHGPLVQIPYSNDINDFAVFSRGAMAASGAFERFRDEFDILYEESETSGRIMNIGLHPHVMGRGFAVKALRQFISYVKDIDGVWFPKREEISDWYAENHASHIRPD